MDPTGRLQLIKQNSLARVQLSRIQNFIEAGDQKVKDIQVSFKKMTDIFNRYDIAQRELELLDDTNTRVMENYLKTITMKFKLSSVKFYISNGPTVRT